MGGFGSRLNWVSDEAWVVTGYRTYKLADRGVVVGGTLKYGDHSLKSHALRGLLTAKRSNFFVHKIYRITEMCSCIKNALQMASRFTWV